MVNVPPCTSSGFSFLLRARVRWHSVVPQAVRYQLEMEMALTMLAGLADGTFRPDLDREQTQVMLQCLLAGASVSRGEMFRQLQQGVERWLLTEEIWKATRGAEQ